MSAKKQKSLHPEAEAARRAFGFDPIGKVGAKVEAQGYLRLYTRTRNGWFFWRAWEEYRRAGLPIPSTMLVKVDQIAARLMQVQDVQGFAKALEMTSGKQARGGGAQGATAARQTLRTRLIVQRVHDLIAVGTRPEAAYKRVALPMGKTADQVKHVYLRWKRKA